MPKHCAWGALGGAGRFLCLGWDIANKQEEGSTGSGTLRPQEVKAVAHDWLSGPVSAHCEVSSLDVGEARRKALAPGQWEQKRNADPRLLLSMVPPTLQCAHLKSHFFCFCSGVPQALALVLSFLIFPSPAGLSQHHGFKPALFAHVPKISVSSLGFSS